MTARYPIPTRRERNIRYLTFLGIGLLVGFILGAFAMLLGLGVIR